MHDALRATSTPATIEWKPFLIDPGTAIDGEEFEAYNRRRWGGSGWTRDLPLDAMFQNWKWWPNTVRAHQWVQYMMEKHNLKSDHLNSVLFQALYEEGKNLSDVEILLQLASSLTTEHAMDIGDLRSYLEDNQGLDQIHQEIAEGRRRYQIRGVPLFLVRGPSKKSRPLVLRGAQPVAAFREAFDEVVSNPEA